MANILNIDGWEERMQRYASVSGYATQTDINNAISAHVATYHSSV